MAAETPPEAMEQVLLPAEQRSFAAAPNDQRSLQEAQTAVQPQKQSFPQRSFQERGIASFQESKQSFPQRSYQEARLSFSEVQVVIQHEAPPIDPLSRVPQSLQGPAYFCKQFFKRVWQLLMYLIFVVPPSIVVGFLCSALLYGIKLATAVRNGTCEDTGYWELLDTEKPLVACEHVVGAKRWLLFFLSFSGLFVAALYTYLGNANAAGGMNTILKSIRKMEEEIDNMCEEQKRREDDGEPLVRPVQSEEFTNLVALRMCPLVFIGTVSTHLCGGSAGREGSALQMAASIFSKYCDLLDATLGRANPNFLLSLIHI